MADREEVATREAPQPAQSELLTVPARITLLNLVGFGQLPVGAVRRIDERLDLLFISGKFI